MEKSPDALKTIGEVAELLGLETHVLRFWEEQFPHLNPQKLRGNRRYYSPEDVALLQQIKHLLYVEGFTLEGARKRLAEMQHEPAAAEIATNPLHSSLEALHRELLAIRGIVQELL
jgi:DNA-binding transcriptional MerR regulator